MRKLILQSTLLLCGLVCVSCSSPDREPSIGDAYVGPATLNLRQELAPKSPVSGTVKHGDHLEILATRRRFLKVRTSDDKQGWVDGYQLLTPQQMTDLRDLAVRAQKLPSQGAATIYDVLNMHTEPSRQAPSFYQIPEKGVVEVVGHKVSARGFSAAIPSVAASIKEAPARKKRAAKPVNSKKLGPPPVPTPPSPPPNWIDLSKTNRGGPAAVQAVPVSSKPKLPGYKPQLTDAEKALILEDWSLVRTRDGRVGWVLTRPLVMSIPDEVAQYAEGRRITSYFGLSDREGSSTAKQSWLWTTAQKAVEPFEFDAVRVFTYNTRKRRYETAFSEKNLKGFYPVEVALDESAGPGGARFSFIVQDDQGNYFRKRYSFTGHSVRLSSREPFQLADPKDLQKEPLTIAQAQAVERSWYERTKDAVGHQWKRWFQ
jgi:hypothetical protein